MKEEITEKEIQDKIKATLAKLGGQKGGGKSGNQRQKLRRQRREDHKTIREEEQLQKEKESMVLKVTEFVTANELSVLMDVSVNEIITACFSLGMMVSINQRLDAETIQIVAEETFAVRGVPTPTRHHRIISDKFTIDLWYTMDDEWVGLQSTTKDGKKLRYELQ